MFYWIAPQLVISKFLLETYEIFDVSFDGFQNELVVFLHVHFEPVVQI